MRKEQGSKTSLPCHFVLQVDVNDMLGVRKIACVRPSAQRVCWRSMVIWRNSRQLLSHRFMFNGQIRDAKSVDVPSDWTTVTRQTTAVTFQILVCASLILGSFHLAGANMQRPEPTPSKKLTSEWMTGRHQGGRKETQRPAADAHQQRGVSE